MNAKQYLTDVQAAEIMGLAVQTLRNWRCNRKGPKYSKIGRSCRYSQESIQIFMENNLVETQGKF